MLFDANHAAALEGIFIMLCTPAAYTGVKAGDYAYLAVAGVQHGVVAGNVCSWWRCCCCQQCWCQQLIER